MQGVHGWGEFWGRRVIVWEFVGGAWRVGGAWGEGGGVRGRGRRNIFGVFIQPVTVFSFKSPD